MSDPLIIDPFLFTPDAVDEETRQFHERESAKLADLPDKWSSSPKTLRNARQEGKTFFPLEPDEPTVKIITIDGLSKHDPPLTLRHFTPKTGKPRGTFLHIHGGGWYLGSANMMDTRLQELADRSGVTCLSAEYRLAPENPYPKGVDDCEAAALWLLKQGKDHADFPAPYLIGGESAGAHLSTLTLLCLRDRHDLTPFSGAVLTSGVYDLGGTASARDTSEIRLVLEPRDMRMFARNFLQNGEDERSPHISPLFARLDHMPPALFGVGTYDILLDDTLAMATRWHAANGNAQLDIVPGGCHLFQNFRDMKIARNSNALMDDFISEIVSAKG